MKINLKLSHKLIALFMIMAAIVLFTGSFGMWSVNKVGGSIQDILHMRADQQKLAYLIKISLNEAQSSLSEAIVARPGSDDFQTARDNFDAKSTFIHNYCDILLHGNATLGIPAVKKGGPLFGIIEELDISVTEYDVTCNGLLDKMSAQLASGGISAEQGRELKASIRLSQEKTTEKIDNLLLTVNNLMDKANSDAAQIRRTANTGLIIASLLAILLAVFLGVSITRHIVHRIRMIADSLAQGASGDLTVAVADCLSDEIGMLGTDFNIMASKLSGMFSGVKKTISELSVISSDIGGASNKSASAARNQSVDIDHMSQAINVISASISNVTKDADELSLSAAEASTATQEMAASLSEVACKTELLAISVESVSSSVTEMASSVKMIDINVENLASSTNITTSSVVALDEAIVQIKQNAVTTAGISNDVLRDAELGQASVQAAIAGMQRIKLSSQTTSEVMEAFKIRTMEIGSILTVISEVAEQTNLLAFNAAIIAAQAGEHGKGFAVVASEIKELADRTSHSTNEIAAVVKSVQQEALRAAASIKDAEEYIHEGEKLSVDSGLALDKIYAGVKKASEQMGEIAQTAEEQARQSQQIRSVTGMVSDMVDQIARATREQGKGSELIVAAVHEMKEHNFSVRLAIQEQSLTGSMLSDQTLVITNMCERLQHNVHDQLKQFDLIVSATSGIQNSAEVNLKTSKVTNDSAVKLALQVQLLQKEMDNFKVSEE